MKKIISVIIIGTAVLLTGCGKPVELDVKLKAAQAQINIFGRLDDNDQTDDYIMVRKSVSYLHPADNVYVQDATVSVKDENGNIIVFTHIGQGMYTPPAVYSGIVVGKSYTMEVLYNGTSYTATSVAELMTTTPEINPFERDSVAKRNLQNSFGDTTGYVVSLFMRDDPTIKNYYYINVFRNDTLVTSSLPSEGRSLVYTFDDSYLDGSVGAMETTLFNKFQLGDKVKVDLYTINYQTLKFYESLDIQANNSGSIFDGPPANIVGNISNGALGYFYVSSSVTDTLTVKLKQ